MFFFLELYYDLIINEAFQHVCADKMLVDGYIDLNDYIRAKINKEYFKQELTAINSPFTFLFEKSFPKGDAAYDFWKENTNELRGLQHLFSAIEYEAIVYWVYRVQRTQEERTEFTIQLFKNIKDLYDIRRDIKTSKGIFYNSKKIEIRFISSLAEFNKEIDALSSSDEILFFRGHADMNYVLQPSIMRKENWLSHEQNMYNELIIDCPESFSKCNTHLEKLVEMQHYGLPTRLLDITRNPLVALYFACVDLSDKNGEVVLISSKNCTIKYPQSDCVSILSSLPVFPHEDLEMFRCWALSITSVKDFNRKIDRLIKEIQTEKPGFSATIKQRDLLSSYIVLAVKNNRRIINQDGAFILCGLIDKRDLLNNYRYQKNGKKVIIVVDGKKKAQILRQLKSCSIHYATMFPEIECVSEFIKNKYT